MSDNGDILFQVMDAGNGKNPEMKISKSEILFSNVDSFKVIDPVNNTTHFWLIKIETGMNSVRKNRYDLNLVLSLVTSCCKTAC